MSAAGVFPKWGLLESVVFRRDDDESFADETEAPVRASCTTTWGANILIAFSFAEPPKISRLYAQLPGFPPPDKAVSFHVLAAHRHLVLLCISRPSVQIQNFLIFRAGKKNNPSSSSLTVLPPCTEPELDSRSLRPRRRTPNAAPRWLNWMCTGLWCGDREEEFVVAELTLYVRRNINNGLIRIEAAANICFLRSSFTDDDRLGPHKWSTVCLPIMSATHDDLLQLSGWLTHAGVFPFQRWMCWVGYHRGILFWDVSKEEPARTLSFVWFPPDKYSLAIPGPFKPPCSGNGGVTVVDQGRTLKFAYVARNDSREAFAAPKPGTGFSITCYTLVFGDDDSMAWKEDYTVTSDELPDYLQRGGLPMFPRIDVVRPQVVHFLFCELLGTPCKRMSVLSIDMSTKTVESFYLYVDASEFFKTDHKDRLPTDDPVFIRVKSVPPIPSPFLPCELPRFCCLSRKRKDME